MITAFKEQRKKTKKNYHGNIRQIYRAVPSCISKTNFFQAAAKFINTKSKAFIFLPKKIDFTKQKIRNLEIFFEITT